jgi:3-phosphoshikimate 1-carboxyvinyltransferase
MDKLIRPARNVTGALRMPGDKSISHRYAMLAGVARGKSRFENFSTGEDCASTLRCIQDLGCTVKREGPVVEVESQGEWRSPSAPLDCGNSGSTMRMLAGILAGRGVACEMVGDSSLMRRPMSRIVEPLRKMGAEIGAGEGGKPPVRIAKQNGTLRGIDYEPPTPSAQVKSSLLFAGSFAEGRTTVRENVRTRDHGELALRTFGARVDRTKDSVSIAGGQELTAVDAYVPGDISSAAFFFAASALFPESNLVLEGVGMNPTRAAILDVLTSFGARVSVLNLEEHQAELIGTGKVSGGALRGGQISGGLSARLIDELPLLAAIAPYTSEGVEIRDARELRVKESDRIAITAENLRRMGAEVEEFEDGMRIRGGQSLHGAELDTHGDHRIGMAFAIAGLRAEGDTLIRNAEAVAVSFPEFWDYLDRVTER